MPPQPHATIRAGGLIRLEQLPCQDRTAGQTGQNSEFIRLKQLSCQENPAVSSIRTDRHNHSHKIT